MHLRTIFALTLTLAATTCRKTAGHGTSVARAECDTIDYQARGLSARISVPNQGALEIDTSKQAIRDVDVWVEKYLAGWSTACRDYRNGALTREEYRDETQRIRQAMERFEALALQLEKPSSAEEFDTTLRAAWNAVAPPGEGADLSVELRVMAKRPGEADFAVVPPGVTLPTGTELYTIMRLGSTANVSFYQVDVHGKTNVLFPDPAIAIANPLAGDQELRLPPNGVFVLDDKDLGIEDLHVLATTEPLPATPSAPPAAAPSGASTCNTRGMKFVADSCPKSRGLVFRADPGKVSIKAANAAAQRGVHVVYTYHHVGDANSYGKKCPGRPDEKCRGIEPLKSAVARRPPKMPDNFTACPGDAVVKEMPGPGGSYERWCVELDAQKQLVDHGPYRKWYSSGKLWVTGQLELGQRKGTWTTYDAAGQTLATVSY